MAGRVGARNARKRRGASKTPSGAAGRKGVGDKAARQIARRFREWIQAEGWSQESRDVLAEELEVPKSTLSGWLATKPHTPELTHILQMAARYQLNPQWLLLGTGGMKLGTSQPPLVVGNALREHILAGIIGRVGAADGRVAAGLVPAAEELLSRVVANQAGLAVGGLAEARRAVAARLALETILPKTNVGRPMLRHRLEVLRATLPGVLRPLALPDEKWGEYVEAGVVTESR